MDYLANKLEDNATNTRVKNEIISATPTEETEIRALIPGAYPELDEDLSRNTDGAIGNDPVRQAGNINKTFECAGMVPSKRFWSSLSEQISPTYCQEATLFAYADYTKAKATGTSPANSANNQNYVPYMYTPSSSVITFINELKDSKEV